MAKLTAPSGATVEVAEDRVGNLLRNGFTEQKAKTPAKKSAPSKSGKK